MDLSTKSWWFYTNNYHLRNRLILFAFVNVSQGYNTAASLDTFLDVVLKIGGTILWWNSNWLLCRGQSAVVGGGQSPLLKDRRVNCNSNNMEVSFEFSTPFSGVIYTNKYYPTTECRWEGAGNRRMVVSIPLNTNPSQQPYCGVQVQETLGEFSVMLIISPMQGILVEGMMGLTVRCLYNIADVTLTLPVGPNGAGIFISPQTQAGVVTGNGGTPFLQMAIRDGHGISNDIIQAASVGQRITLDVIMQDTTIYDFYVHDCYAHDGSSSPEASISIIDANGCSVPLSRAVDAPVFETPLSSDGPKHVYIHMYGFQFTTSQLVYFECQVRPCLRKCDRQQCSGGRAKRSSSIAQELEAMAPRRRRRQAGIGGGGEDPSDDYNLTAVIQIKPQQILDVVPAAQFDSPLQIDGRSRSDGRSSRKVNEVCVDMGVGIGILVIFVLVCIISLMIALFICRRAQKDGKSASTIGSSGASEFRGGGSYYTPASTPTSSLPPPTHSRNTRH